ncbi:MAG: ACP S-malonyltransferase [Proteobacteria bacterium]|nr:ACP S-malonyltransferase [Pseudomonadota bacterium]
MKKYAMLFPGQGSQSIGMMAKFGSEKVIKKTFDEASAIIGNDLWKIISVDNNEINQTVNTQPIMLAAGIAIWRLLKERDIDDPVFIAGHSLGEFTALVAAGVMTFEDAVKIVAKRAQLMQEAVPNNKGAMAAILGLDDQTVIRICNELNGEEIIEAVNFNSPGQVVIAGHKSIIDNSLEKFKEAGAKRALLLPVSVPSHCQLMKPAAEEFLVYLKDFNFNVPMIKVIHNVDVMSHQSIEDIKDCLAKQLYNPVQWTRTIQKLYDEGTDTFVEGGPGRVLMGLNKRIVNDCAHYSLDSSESTTQFVSEIII